MIPLMVQYQISIGSSETAEELRVVPVMFGISVTFPIDSEIIPVAISLACVAGVRGWTGLSPTYFSHFVSSVQFLQHFGPYLLIRTEQTQKQCHTDSFFNLNVQ